ncbi:MAG TPA: succinate dehydrogenase/fumarate reductase flavoprotein subunit, partial [candidate division Zixibacteria bacterium]|nr:succinate dehydrogenase/fumarate reductase flavoprotein subunit [candidate division Zixibacteria bacterium]
VHGANRLGGNSLLETIVFGAQTGKVVADKVKGMSQTIDTDTLNEGLDAEKDRYRKLQSSEGKANPYEIRNELSRIMNEKLGIFRNETDMKAAVDEIKMLKINFENLRPIPDTGKFNYDFLWVTEIAGNLDTALAIATGGLNRTESRGAHFRIDHTKRLDDEWLKHTLYKYHPEDPEITYKPVTLGKYEPEERKY